MEKHLCIVLDEDVAISIIGSGIEQFYEQYMAYHKEELSESSPRGHAVNLANWFLTRGFQVYVYPYEGGWKDMICHKFFLWLGKKIGEVLPGIVVGRPKAQPETTIYV